MAEIFSSLFQSMLNTSEKENKKYFEKFHFVNDAGHCENALYALRHCYGQLSLQDLKSFRSKNSCLTGHSENHLFPEGVYLSNGPLGSSLAMAQGLAVAEKLNNTNKISIMSISDHRGRGRLFSIYRWTYSLLNKKIIMSFSGFAQDQSSDDSGSSTLLVEFDTRDYPSMGEPKVSVNSLEIKEINATKIGENLYFDKGGCSSCTLVAQVAKYTITIPMERSLSLRYLGSTQVWSEQASWSTEREYSVPSGILERETSDPGVLASVASGAERVLGLLSAVRRGEVGYDKKTKTCYTTYFRGTYNPETLSISSIHVDSELIECPK